MEHQCSHTCMCVVRLSSCYAYRVGRVDSCQRPQELCELKQLVSYQNIYIVVVVVVVVVVAVVVIVVVVVVVVVVLVELS